MRSVGASPRPARPLGAMCQLGRQAGGDCGAAVVLGVVWMAALSALALTGVVLVAVWSAHGRAQGAADLAALAGAARILDGQGAACEGAAVVARANDAQMLSCEVTGIDVWVTAQVAVPVVARPALMGRVGAIRGRAHATLTSP